MFIFVVALVLFAPCDGAISHLTFSEAAMSFLETPLPTIIHHSNSTKNYTVYNYSVPMRDGVHLGTFVYIPKINGTELKKPTVAMFDSSPYYTKQLNIRPFLLLIWQFMRNVSECIMVAQAERGTMYSGGSWEGFRHVPNDTEDTINWIVKQKWSNGVIVPSGISAMGISSYLATKSAVSITNAGTYNYPVMPAQVIEWGSPAMYNNSYQQGLFRYYTNYAFLVYLTASSSLWDTVLQHEAPASDSWWNGNQLDYDDYLQVNWPSVQQSAWYDLFQQGQLVGLRKYRSISQQHVQDSHILVVGPAGHCFGLVSNPTYYHTNMTAYIVQDLIFNVLHGLVIGTMGHGKTWADFDARLALWKLILDLELKRNIWYVWGPPVSYTEQYLTAGDTFPTPMMTSWYIAANNTLSTSTPTTTTPLSYTYVFNPNEKPVPSAGGNTLGTAANQTCGPANLDSIKGRKDVLTFTTESPLSKKMALCGEARAYLYVESSAPDTDFMVRVVDVFPNGTRWLIMEGGIRMRWREGTAQPVLLKPGVVYHVQIDLWELCYIFQPGHSIGIDVMSSNYPHFSVNPNTGIPLAKKQAAHNITATNTIKFATQYPSRVELPIVHISDIPRWEPKIPRMKPHHIRRHWKRIQQREKLWADTFTVPEPGHPTHPLAGSNADLFKH